MFPLLLYKSYSARIAHVLCKYNIKTFYKLFDKLQKIFGLPEDPIEPNRRCGVLYYEVQTSFTSAKLVTAFASTKTLADCFNPKSLSAFD